MGVFIIFESSLLCNRAQHKTSGSPCRSPCRSFGPSVFLSHPLAQPLMGAGGNQLIKDVNGTEE